MEDVGHLLQTVELWVLKVFSGHFKQSPSRWFQYVPAGHSQCFLDAVDVTFCGQDEHDIDLGKLYVFSGHPRHVVEFQY